MVLTITLNPLLERRLRFDTSDADKNNRNGKLKLSAGGKGINVSRQVSKLGLKTFAYTLAGGNNGKLFKEEVRKEGIELFTVQTKNELRDAFVIIDDLSVKTYFRENAIVLADEKEQFVSKLDKMIQNCEIVVLSGSSVDGCEDVFPYCIQLANKYDKISVCDTYGKNLASCIEEHPTVLHNNLNEINSSLGLSISSEKEIVELLHSFYNRGVKQAFITNGSKDVYASNFDFVYKVKPPKVKERDATGSGDAFTAGVVLGHYRDLTFNETLQIAAAIGAANAFSLETCTVSEDQFKLLINQVEVSTIGKKIKIIDDRPQ